MNFKIGDEVIHKNGDTFKIVSMDEDSVYRVDINDEDSLEPYTDIDVAVGYKMEDVRLK